MRIVIDALGSDNKINDILDGVISSMKRINNYEFTIVGPKYYISDYLEGKVDSKRLELIDAIDEVDDFTNPLSMLRDLDKTALVKALKRTSENDAIGLITCSNTGCVLVGSIMHIGLVDKKIMTPVLCCLIKDINMHDICLADCGANINSTSENLLTYAKYANAFMKSYLNKDNPKVGLLSNGKNDKKGDNVIKGANTLLRDSNLNFVGNIEASDIFTSDIDCLVCDGMLGNVVLKNSEGVAKNIMSFLSNDKDKEKITNMFDYSNLGGSFLLGTKKMVIKTHGNVSSQTIDSVVDRLITLYENDYISKIENI
jgi:glycerol-3-phosphate acyltransferase PlsX